MSNAQGFLGRKFIVKYDFHTGLAVSNPSYRKAISIDATGQSFHNSNNNSAKVGLNKKHEIGGEYLYNRFHSIGFFIGITRTSIDHQYNEAYNYYSGTNKLLLYNPYDLRIKLYSYNFEIKWTKYSKRGGIAPLGLYRTWSIGYLQNSIFDQTEFESGVKKSKIHQFGVTTIGFELGKQKVYYDRILINFGFSLRYLIGSPVPSFYMISIMTDGAYNNPFDKNPKTEQGLLEYNAKDRLSNHQLFNLKFGVAYLIK